MIAARWPDTPESWLDDEIEPNRILPKNSFWNYKGSAWAHAAKGTTIGGKFTHDHINDDEDAWGH